MQLIGRQIREIETARLERLTRQPNAGAHPMIRLLTQVRRVGVETADLLANEAFARRFFIPRAQAFWAKDIKVSFANINAKAEGSRRPAGPCRRR